jgi:hypothetical protein
MADYFRDKDDINKTWDEWLTAFRKEIYPTFEKQGMAFGEAVVLYRMNVLYNRLTPDEPDEPWRSGG